MDGKKEGNVTVGANIKRAREKAGYTQERFAERLGVGPKSLSSIEQGVVGVSLTLLLKVCEILSVSPNVIFLEQTRKNDTGGETLRGFSEKESVDKLHKGKELMQQGLSAA